MTYPQVTVIEKKIEKNGAEAARLAAEAAVLNASLKEVQTLIEKMRADGTSEKAIRAELAEKYGAAPQTRAKASPDVPKVSGDTTVLNKFPLQGFITTVELAESTGLSKVQVRNALHNLLSSSKIKQEGEKRAAKYTRA